MSMRRVAPRAMIGLALSSVSAGAFGCGHPEPAGGEEHRAAGRVDSAGAQAAAGEVARIRVVMGRWLTFAPLHIARTRGFFADQGLEVEFVDIPSTGSGIPLLHRGDIDVLPGPLTPAFFHAIGRGARVRFVAAKGFVDPLGCPFTALVVRPSFVEELERAIAVRTQAAGVDPAGADPAGADPAGKSLPGGTPELLVRGRRPRMSISLEPQLRYFVARALDSRGLSLADFESVHVPTAAEIGALKRGTLDAALMDDPGITQAREMLGADLWLTVTDVIPGYQYALIAYGPRLLDENPELGRRFMVAYLAGVRAYNDGKTDQNVSILAKSTGFEPGLLRAICWPPIRGDGRIDLPSLEAYRDWYVDQELLDAADASVELWDPSFIEHANRVLIHSEEDVK